MKKLIWILIIAAIIGGIYWYTGSRRNASTSTETTPTSLDMEREAFVSDMQIKLDRFKEGIEELKKQAAQKTGDARESVEKRIEALQDEWENARSQMEKAASAGADQWQSIVESTVSAFDRMKNAFDAAKEELTR